MYDTLCEKARLTNGIGKVGIKNGQLLTKELVVKADPDFFLVAAPWKGDAYNYEKFKEEFLQDPSLKNLRGIRNIKVLPNRYLYSASPNCVFAIKALANVGYGAIFDLSGEHFLKGY